MLNNKKIKTMTKLALYEQSDGKEDLRISKYYKTDYVRLHVLKTAVSVTVGYILLLVMIGMYKAEYLIKNLVKLNLFRIGQYILEFYIIIMAVYVTGSIIGYSLKYSKSRKDLSKYYKALKKLNDFYQDENANG